MNKHTPGPWHVEPESKGSCVRTEDGFYITETVDAAGMDSDDTTLHANARLISTAPDLLAVLQGILKCERGMLGHIFIEGWHEEVIRSAIQKATGETA